VTCQTKRGPLKSPRTPSTSALCSWAHGVLFICKINKDDENYFPENNLSLFPKKEKIITFNDILNSAFKKYGKVKGMKLCKHNIRLNFCSDCCVKNNCIHNKNKYMCKLCNKNICKSENCNKIILKYFNNIDNYCTK
jgi:hypothetical protein